jgi:hypothetical protein
MNVFLDSLVTVYTKEKKIDLSTVNDIGTAIGITKVLSKNERNLPILSKLIDFLFFIEPSHYLCLLFYQIPKVAFVPKSQKVLTNEVEYDIIDVRLKELLHMTQRELAYSKPILDMIITDKKQWKERLGLDG